MEKCGKWEPPKICQKKPFVGKLKFALKQWLVWGEIIAIPFPSSPRQSKHFPLGGLQTSPVKDMVPEGKQESRAFMSYYTSKCVVELRSNGKILCAKKIQEAAGHPSCHHCRPPPGHSIHYGFRREDPVAWSHHQHWVQSTSAKATISSIVASFRLVVTGRHFSKK